MNLYKKNHLKQGLMAFLVIIGLTLASNPAIACSGTSIFQEDGANSAVNDQINSAGSLNWAGYVASAGKFTGVGASWIVPKVSAPDNRGNLIAGGDATWVGIGGVHGDDLIQAGTMAITDPNGMVSYQAWYELLPDFSKKTSLEVKPGDILTVAINQIGLDLWSISLINNTTGNDARLSVSYESSLSSAEWIEEAPLVNYGYMDLNDFETVNFYDAWAIRDGKKVNLLEAEARPVSMVNLDGEITARTGKISDNGSFIVSRANANSASPLSFIVSEQDFNPDFASKNRVLSYSEGWELFIIDFINRYILGEM